METVIVHSHKYAEWVFDKNHPTQGRRFILAKEELARKLNEKNIHHRLLSPRTATFGELTRVHDSDYVKSVLNQHVSNEWIGKRFDLSELAALFAGGTLVALEELLASRTLTAIHFPGAKHHAQFDYSSGFCVFNDFALAADIASKVHGKKVAILDIDAHHGDGTEFLTSENQSVLTYSIHQYGIFPGTGLKDLPDKEIYNFPIYPENPDKTIGMGDNALLHGALDFLQKIKGFNPDLLFIACGADGHFQDPLSNLNYSTKGIAKIAKLIRTKYPQLPILLSGAGGYLPDTRTPEIWSEFALALSTFKANQSN
jgi:acetoin utilization protein AcuC